MILPPVLPIKWQALLAAAPKQAFAGSLEFSDSE